MTERPRCSHQLRSWPLAYQPTHPLKPLLRPLFPSMSPFAQRVAALQLDTVELDPDWEDVIDPAGGDADVFVETAAEIAEQIHLLAPRLVP